MTTSADPVHEWLAETGRVVKEVLPALLAEREVLILRCEELQATCDRLTREHQATVDTVVAFLAELRQAVAPLQAAVETAMESRPVAPRGDRAF